MNPAGHKVLNIIGHAAGIGLVIYGSIVPGAEVAIGGGMSLIAATTAIKTLAKKEPGE